MDICHSHQAFMQIKTKELHHILILLVMRCENSTRIKQISSRDQ